MAKQNKPAIRFKEFTDAWEQRKLGDNIVEYTEVTTENNQYPPLTSSRKGIFLQTEYFAGNQIASDDNTGYNIVPYGYFTYRHMSDDEVFHFNINDIVEKGIVSTLYPVFTTDENLDSRYLQYQLNYGHEFAKFAILQKQGGSRTYMYLNKLRQLHLTMPNHVEEQKAISSFFMNLDHLITLHQRKYDKLQVLKKAMLEKMFPKNGSSVPEIRFKGFTDAWEQRKLTEFVEFFSGLTYTPNDVQENGTLVLRSSNVSNGEVVNADNVYVNPQVVNSENVKVGDIVVVVRNGSRSLIGKHAQIKAFMPNTVIGAFMTGIRSECPEFTNALLNTSRFEEEIAMNMGATINQITGYMFSKMEFKVPCLDEQKKIGEYFEKLDNLITLHQRELEKLQNIKKSMLEKMFV